MEYVFENICSVTVLSHSISYITIPKQMLSIKSITGGSAILNGLKQINLINICLIKNTFSAVHLKSFLFVMHYFKETKQYFVRKIPVTKYVYRFINILSSTVLNYNVKLEKSYT